MIREWINRATRVQFSTLHNADFVFKNNRFQVANISATGIGLLPIPQLNLKSGDKLEGSLLMNSKRLDLELEVAQINSKLMGCQITKSPPDFVPSLVEYLTIEILAARMEETNKDSLKSEPEGTPRFWFNPDSNMELFVVINPKNEVHKFHMSFLSNYIEGEIGKPILFGVLSEDLNPDNTDLMKIKGSTVIHIEKERKPGLLDLAVRFVSNVQGLNETSRDQILKMIRN